MKDCRELEHIETIQSGNPDHAFVCAASPEPRCLGTVNKLSSSYRASKSIIIEYEHKCEERNRNVAIMEKRLRNVGPVERFIVNESRPLPRIRDLIQDIFSSIHPSDKPRVTLDISTLRKWHILLILKAFDQIRALNTLRVLYTEPLNYVLDQPLSFYIREIFPVPLFQGHFSFGRNTLLAIILGYEGDRAVALFENTDPEECILFIPKPAYHPEWDGRTEQMNKEIINLVGYRRVYDLHSLSPSKICQQLEDHLLSTEFCNHNHFIATLGTKPQVIGVYDYFRRHWQQTSIISVSPLRHSNIYSKGIGRTWVLRETD